MMDTPGEAEISTDGVKGAGKRLSRLRSEWPWLLAFVPLTVLLTCPLTPRLTTALAGDHGDTWQNLWNLVWLRRSLWQGRNPFFTEALWHPDGTTLVFQTFDLPDLVPAALLVGPLHPWTVYNLVVLWTFVASGLAMYALSRGLGASRPASFLAGCAFTFSTYHFAHALGHLHILAMQWVPLYVLAFVRALETRSWRWAAAGGGLLVLASLSSWYYLAGAFVVSLPLFLLHLVRRPRRTLLQAGPRLLVLCGVYLALIAPLGWAMVTERAAEPISGAHEARRYSADLESFAVPNAAQALGQRIGRHTRWSGNAAENGTYLGWMLLALVGAGLWLNAPRVRAWGLVALFGLVLSLGPALRVGGAVVTGDVLPYAWAEQWFPLLSFMGVPVRFAFAATLALAAALAPSLDALASRLGWWVVAPLAVVAIAEHAPHAFVTSSYPTPPPVAAWADEPESFAVLDATRDSRHLWHQTVHGKPMLGGYLTRTPNRLEKRLKQDPVAGPLIAWETPEVTVPVSFASLDFPYGKEIVPGADRTRFSLDVAGVFRAETDGEYTFALESDDGSELFLGGRRLIDNGGRHAAVEKRARVTLAAGSHALRVRYRQEGGGHLLRLRWAPPGGTLRLLDQAVIPGGLSGTARVRRRQLVLEGEAGREHLRSLGVRYVLQNGSDSRWPTEHQLELRSIHEDPRLRIYEVPGSTGAASR